MHITLILKIVNMNIKIFSEIYFRKSLLFNYKISMIFKNNSFIIYEINIYLFMNVLVWEINIRF